MSNMTIVLRAKHWQIFLIFVGSLFLNAIVGPSSELADDLTYLIFFTIQIGWILVLGFELNKRCKLKRTFWPILIIGLVVILYGWIFRLSMDLAQTAVLIKNLEPYEWYAIGAISIALMVLMVLISAFPAKALKLIEMKGDVDINDYFNDFLSIMFWPIGIWFIQPRINKIAVNDGQPTT